MAKLFVAGVMEWGTFGPYAITSVESGQGEGVQGLQPENFAVGSVGMGGGWIQHSVTDVTPIGGVGRGFYYLSLKPGEPLTEWMPYLCNLVFTIEVVTGLRREPGDHGQAIAINKCCNQYNWDQKLGA